MKVVKLLALRTGHHHSSENIPGTHFCYRPSRPHGRSAAGSIVSIKKTKTSSVYDCTVEDVEYICNSNSTLSAIL